MYSPNSGHQPSGGGGGEEATYGFSKIPKNCVKLKEFGPGEKGCPSHPRPLDPPMVYTMYVDF